MHTDIQTPNLAVNSHVASANIPGVITKELGMANIGERRRIRVSSNFLPLMGFEFGTRHDVTPLGFDKGLRLSFNPHGVQQVYQRRYARRCNNPFETVVEIGNQSALDNAIPAYTERVHIEMRRGEIFIRPLANRTFSIRKAMRESTSDLAAFVAMTGGVDVRCLMDCGFSIDSILEYRPSEARDVRDLTETGALNVLANSKPRVLFNEDISTIDWNMVRGIMDSGPQIACMAISLQCDEFSPVKSNSLKQRSIDDLSTSRDLVYDALRAVETIRPATIMLEQVGGFATSEEGALFALKLRKWGYYVTDGVLAAPDFGGLTGRKRYYLCASIWPNFTMPSGNELRTSPIWSEVESYLEGCRDVTHTKSLQDGLTTGRARLLTPQSMIAPTVLKSQSRQAKDSVFIAPGDGRYLFPSLELLQHLNGIPSDFNLSCVSSDIASEIIGQSIDMKMHHALTAALHAHISSNIGRHTVVNITKQVAPANLAASPESQQEKSVSVSQMALEF